MNRPASSPLRRLGRAARHGVGWIWRRRIAVVVLVVVAGFTGGGLTQLRVDTGITSFMPSGDDTYQALEQKARSFGGDPVVVLLKSNKPRELLLKEEKLGRLVGLEGQLSRLPDVAAVYGPATALNQTAAAAQNMLAQISGRRDALRNEAIEQAKKEGASDAEAQAKGREAIAEFDRRYGSLLVQGLPAGLPTLRNPQFVSAVLFGEDGQPRPRWDFLVPDERTVAVLVRPRQDLDQAAAGMLTDAVRSTVADAGLGAANVTVTGVPVLTSALTERARAEAPILGVVALVTVGAVFLFVPWSARRRSRLRPLACALLGTGVVLAAFGWLDRPVSLGVVAFLPILLGIGSDFPFYLSQPGQRRRPVVAALAAAAGFGSLAISPLPFVRELGIALAAGIVCTAGFALLLRKVWGVPAPPRLEPDGAAVDVSSARPVWQRAVVLAGVIGIAGVGWAALPRLDIEARPHQLAAGLAELEDARKAEQVLGSAGEVSVVLSGDDVLSPEAVRWTQRAQELIVRQHGDQMRPIITLPDLLGFLGEDPTTEQIDAGMQLLPSYLTSSVVRRDQSSSLLVFGVGLRSVAEQQELFTDVRRTLPPPPQGFDVDLVGLPVSAVRGFELVSDTRLTMNIAGIVAAGLVLLVGLRNRGDVLRALLTVSVATGMVLLIAWALGALSPLTVAIGSLITATGCEFAIMLARRDHRRRLARRGVGTAALAGVLGYLVLALSELAVLREFGILLAAGVACSYLAARVVVWAVPPSGISAAVMRRAPAPREKGVAV